MCRRWHGSCHCRKGVLWHLGKGFLQSHWSSYLANFYTALNYMETKNHLDCVLHFYCTLILNMYIYCDEEVMLCAYNQVEVFFSFWNVKFWIPSSVEFESICCPGWGCIMGIQTSLTVYSISQGVVSVKLLNKSTSVKTFLQVQDLNYISIFRCTPVSPVTLVLQ